MLYVWLQKSQTSYFHLPAFSVSYLSTSGDSPLVYKGLFLTWMCWTNEKMSPSSSICMDILFCIDLHLATNGPVAVKRFFQELWKTEHSSLLADLKQQLIPFCVGAATHRRGVEWQQIIVWTLAFTVMNQSLETTLHHLVWSQSCTLTG